MPRNQRKTTWHCPSAEQRPCYRRPRSTSRRLRWPWTRSRRSDPTPPRQHRHLLRRPWRGPVRDHALDSLYDLHDVGFKIRGCARIAAPDRRQILPYAGSIEEWEDQEEEVDIKAESPSMGDSQHPIVPLAPKRMTLRKKGRGFNNRNPRVVTIRVTDPDLHSEILHLGQARVADMVSSDMEMQGLGPGSFSSTRILPSGDVRLMMPTARRASALKDRQRFRPLSFGKCAYVQQFRPLGRGVLLFPWNLQKYSNLRALRTLPRRWQVRSPIHQMWVPRLEAQVQGSKAINMKSTEPTKSEKSPRKKWHTKPAVKRRHRIAEN